MHFHKARGKGGLYLIWMKLQMKMFLLLVEKCVHICVKHIKGNNGIKIKCRPSKPVEEERRKVK